MKQTSLIVTFLVFLTLCGFPLDAQTISTVIGDGTAGHIGDGGPATAAELYNPWGVFFDASKNLYIADMMGSKGGLFRKVNTSGIITTIAGGGTSVLVDGIPATDEWFSRATAITADGAGNFYVCDYAMCVVWKINTSGVINKIAGKGTAAYSGDGGPGTAAELSAPTGLAVDVSGNIYVADGDNNRVRKINAAGIITTVAGNGASGYSGDGGPATSAKLQTPSGVAVDGSGNLYISDKYNGLIRKVDPTGIITTVAGGGSGGPGSPATSASIGWPDNVAVDAGGNIYIVGDNAVLKVSTSGTLYHISGCGSASYSGDGGPATAGCLNRPLGVAVNGKGDVYFSDQVNNRVRKVNLGSLATEKHNIIDDMLEIGPNPTNGRFTLRGNGSNEQIEISVSNMLGQTVFKEQIQLTDRHFEKEITLDKHLSRGIYLIHVQTDSGIKTRKILVED